MLVDRGSCGLTTKAGSVPYNAQAIAKKTSYFCAILQIETCPVNFVRNSGTRDVCPSRSLNVNSSTFSTYVHKCRDFAEYRSPNRRCVFFARQSSRVPNQSEKVGVSACVPVLLGSRESARAPARLRVLPVTERFHRTVPPVGTRRWKAQNSRALTLVRVVGSWRVPSNCPFAPFLLLFSFPPKHPQYRSHNPHTSHQYDCEYFGRACNTEYPTDPASASDLSASNRSTVGTRKQKAIVF